MVRICLLGLAVTLAPADARIAAQELSSAEALPTNDQHLAIMAKRLEPLKLNSVVGKRNQPATLLQPPIMRSSNTGMNHDGAVWLWLDGTVPIAALSLWNRGPVWYCENTNLSNERLEVTGWQTAKWQPPGTSQRWISQDEAVPEPPTTRQRVLREISRKFAAQENRLGVKSELRVLPRPLYSYSDPQRDIIDGALFVFVLGTDPELFMQIEARANGKSKQWHVAFARMASAELSVNVADKEVWNAAAVPRDANPRFDTDYCMVREGDAKK